MNQTATRLLRLLALLQVRPDWNGPQLAERLGVSTRTIRNDVERLRSLGYPIEAAPGVAGGYMLGAGSSLPPLLLDDEEAVAVAVGLRAAAGRAVTGAEEASMRALAKLEQVLPSRLRPTVEALYGSVLSLQPSGPTVDVEVLSAIAATIRARERLRFDYRAHDGSDSRRRVEPHRLVHTRGRWYLLGWDLDRDDWRTFRVDRVRPSSHTGPRFLLRGEPEGGVAAYMGRVLGSAMWRFRAKVKVHASAEKVSARVPPAVVVEAIDAETCFAEAGSSSVHQLALWLTMIDEDFELEEAPELAEELRSLAARLTRAAAGCKD